MSLNIISMMDLLSFAAIFASFLLCAFHFIKKKSDKKTSIILLLLLFTAGYEAFLLVEWLGISGAFESFEDYIGASLPLCWLFLFQIFSQSTLINALAANEERFTHAMDAVNDGLWDWNVQTGEVFFSPHWYTMLGYSPGELPSRYSTWLNLLHPDDIAQSESALRSHLYRESPFEQEFRMRTKDGRWLWILARGKVVSRSPEGKPLRMVGTHVDINKSREREAQINELQLYLSSIINSMPSILVGVNAQENVTLWNRQAEHDTGVKSQKAMGMPLRDVFSQRSKDIELIQLALKTGQPQVIPHRIRNKDSEVLYENVTAYPLRQRELEGVVIRIDDITEKTRIEEILIQSEKMLSLGGLAAGMAHEINNPLAVILGFANNITRRIFDDMKKNKQIADECGINLEGIQAYAKKRDIDAMLEAIIQSGERTVKIVQSMLGFSRKSTQELQAVCLAELLDNTLELAVSNYEVLKIGLKNIEVIREFQKDLPTVYCDKGKIQQVLFNILRNGIEAMSEKKYYGEKPRVVVRLRSEPHFVVIEIEDNGPGMDENTRKQVFNAFFTTKALGKGTGLGLSISYFIITELHNGQMDVKSIPGKSTCFIIKLPFGAVQS